MTEYASGEDSEAMVRLCHDVRQYVAAALMLTDLPGDEVMDALVRQRLQSVQRALQGAMDLVSLEGRSHVDARVVDLTELVDDCVQTVRATRAVCLETEASAPALVCGDVVSLRRAVMNIIDNASRAVGTHGTVVVRVDQRDGRSSVEVADDGAGFGRIPALTGQGLAILGQAVHECHGRLEIASGPGPGTTVRLTVPTQPWEDGS